jgi:hypothetical protein
MASLQKICGKRARDEMDSVLEKEKVTLVTKKNDICNLPDDIFKYVMEFTGAQDAVILQYVNKHFLLSVRDFIKNYVLKLKNFNGFTFIKIPAYVPKLFQNFGFSFPQVVADCVNDNNEELLRFLTENSSSSNSSFFPIVTQISQISLCFPYVLKCCSIYGNYELWCTFFSKRYPQLEKCPVKLKPPQEGFIHYWQSSVAVGIFYGQVSFVKQLFRSEIIRNVVFTHLSQHPTLTENTESYINIKYIQAIRTVLIYHADMHWDWADPFRLYTDIAELERDAGFDVQNDRVLNSRNVNFWMHELLKEFLRHRSYPNQPSPFSHNLDKTDKSDQFDDARQQSLIKFVKFVYADQKIIMDKEVCRKIFKIENISVDILQETQVTESDIDEWKWSTF